MIKYVSSTLVFITSCGKNLQGGKRKKRKFSLDEIRHFINSKEQKFRKLHKHGLKALNFVASPLRMWEKKQEEVCIALNVPAPLCFYLCYFSDVHLAEC